MRFVDWMIARHGKNWVVARRTAKLVERYGDDVKTFTPKGFKAEQAAFEAETGRAAW